MVEFFKYHGLGNDFALMPAGAYGVSPAEVAAFCDRHRGVGADGIIFFGPPSSDDADWRMTIYNRDGSRPQMCGNGIRCLARHLVEVVGFEGEALRVETDAGLRICHVVSRGPSAWQIAVQMGEARWDAEHPPIAFEGERFSTVRVDMGNPHAVIFEARAIEFIDRFGAWANQERDHFAEGVNLEFTTQLAASHLSVVVYERGVGRTQACGTGACAVAVAAWRTGRCAPGSAVRVELPGGALVIEEREGEVWMTGEAMAVFRGEVYP